MKKLNPSVLCLLLLACIAGCASTSATHRPVVRDERGAVVSELFFPPGERQVTVPLTFDGALLFTDEVKVNGQHVGSFVIDTGAALSALDREAARKLGLTPDKRWSELSTRQPAPDGLYRIDALDLRGVGARNHVIAVLDLSSVRRLGRPEIAGVIGADVFAMMPFTVDYRARELVFHWRDSFEPPSADRSIESNVYTRRELKVPEPFARANPRAGGPVVPARINGQTHDALLDTASGSAVLLMPNLVARRPEWVRGNYVVALAAGAGGAAGLAGFGLHGADVQTVDALGVRFTDIHSAFAIVDDMPRQHAPAILGSRLLSKLRLTFDYAQGKVWTEVNSVVRPPEAAGRVVGDANK